MFSNNAGDRQERFSPKLSPPPTSFSKRDPNKPWEILIAGDFNDRHVELLQSLVDAPEHSRGVLYFDSNGGSVYTALALVTLMKQRQLHCKGIVLGECSSAALLPFAACQERYVPNHSTHLFHPMKWESDENVRLEEAAEWTRHFQGIQQEFDRWLCQLFPMSPEKLKEWTEPGRFVSGAELVAENFANLLVLD